MVTELDLNDPRLYLNTPISAVFCTFPTPKIFLMCNNIDSSFWSKTNLIRTSWEIVSFMPRFPSLSRTSFWYFCLRTLTKKEPSAVVKPDSQLSFKEGKKGLGLKVSFTESAFKTSIHNLSWFILLIVANLPLNKIANFKFSLFVVTRYL